MKTSPGTPVLLFVANYRPWQQHLFLYVGQLTWCLHMLLDRWTPTDQVSPVHFPTWPGVTCQPSVMRHPRVKSTGLALGLIFILYLQQHKSDIKTEPAKSERTVQHTLGFSGLKSDAGSEEERVSQTSFSTLSSSLSSSSPSIIKSGGDVLAEDDVKEGNASSRPQSGNMSQEAIDSEVAAFLTENTLRKQLVMDECRKFRGNSSSGYQRLVARTMAGRTPRAHAFTIVPRRRFDKMDTNHEWDCFWSTEDWCTDWCSLAWCRTPKVATTTWARIILQLFGVKKFGEWVTRTFWQPSTVASIPEKFVSVHPWQEVVEVVQAITTPRWREPRTGLCLTGTRRGTSRLLPIGNLLVPRRYPLIRWALKRTTQAKEVQRLDTQPTPYRPTFLSLQRQNSQEKVCHFLINDVTFRVLISASLWRIWTREVRSRLSSSSSRILRWTGRQPTTDTGNPTGWSAIHADSTTTTLLKWKASAETRVQCSDRLHWIIQHVIWMVSIFRLEPQSWQTSTIWMAEAKVIDHHWTMEDFWKMSLLIFWQKYWKFFTWTLSSLVMTKVRW